MNHLNFPVSQLGESLSTIFKNGHTTASKWGSYVLKTIQPAVRPLADQMKKNYVVAIAAFAVANTLFVLILHQLIKSKQDNESEAGNAFNRIVKPIFVEGIVVGGSIAAFNALISKMTDYRLSYVALTAITAAALVLRFVLKKDAEYLVRQEQKNNETNLPSKDLPKQTTGQPGTETQNNSSEGKDSQDKSKTKSVTEIQIQDQSTEGSERGTGTPEQAEVEPLPEAQNVSTEGTESQHEPISETGTNVGTVNQTPEEIAEKAPEGPKQVTETQDGSTSGTETHKDSTKTTTPNPLKPERKIVYGGGITQEGTFVQGQLIDPQMKISFPRPRTIEDYIENDKEKHKKKLQQGRVRLEEGLFKEDKLHNPKKEIDPVRIATDTPLPLPAVPLPLPAAEPIPPQKTNPKLIRTKSEVERHEAVLELLQAANDLEAAQEATKARLAEEEAKKEAEALQKAKALEAANKAQEQAVKEAEKRFTDYITNGFAINGHKPFNTFKNKSAVIQLQKVQFLFKASIENYNSQENLDKHLIIKAPIKNLVLNNCIESFNTKPRRDQKFLFEKMYALLSKEQIQKYNKIGTGF